MANENCSSAENCSLFYRTGSGDYQEQKFEPAFCVEKREPGSPKWHVVVRQQRFSGSGTGVYYYYWGADTSEFPTPPDGGNYPGIGRTGNPIIQGGPIYEESTINIVNLDVPPTPSDGFTPNNSGSTKGLYYNPSHIGDSQYAGFNIGLSTRDRDDQFSIAYKKFYGGDQWELIVTTDPGGVEIWSKKFEEEPNFKIKCDGCPPGSEYCEEKDCCCCDWNDVAKAFESIS